MSFCKLSTNVRDQGIGVITLRKSAPFQMIDEIELRRLWVHLTPDPDGAECESTERRHVDARSTRLAISVMGSSRCIRQGLTSRQKWIALGRVYHQTSISEWAGELKRFPQDKRTVRRHPPYPHHGTSNHRSIILDTRPPTCHSLEGASLNQVRSS